MNKEQLFLEPKKTVIKPYSLPTQTLFTTIFLLCLPLYVAQETKNLNCLLSHSLGPRMNLANEIYVIDCLVGLRGV